MAAPVNPHADQAARLAAWDRLWAILLRPTTGKPHGDEPPDAPIDPEPTPARTPRRARRSPSAAPPSREVAP